MGGDSISRALLAGILVCLVLLFLQGRGSSGADTGSETSSDRGRFGLVRMVGPGQRPLLIRVDRVTGEVWRADAVHRVPKWRPMQGELTSEEVLGAGAGRPPGEDGGQPEDE